MIKISRGDTCDVPKVMEVMQATFDPFFGEAWNVSQCTTTLALPYTSLWLAEYDGEIAGFAINRWILDEEELLMIGVAPPHRNRKVGCSLINAIKENAIDARRKSIFLEVRDGNEAIYFYQSLGFSKIGKRSSYYTGRDGIKFDAITMALELTTN